MIHRFFLILSNTKTLYLCIKTKISVVQKEMGLFIIKTNKHVHYTFKINIYLLTGEEHICKIVYFCVVFFILIYVRL